MSANSADGDFATILRHLVENTQWGGNQGAKQETMDALDRLTSNQYDEPTAPVEPAEPAAPVEPAKPATSRTASASKRN
jgi:hypothetical protein